MVPTGKGFTIATTVVIAGLTVLAIASHVLVDWLWFSAIGYLDVFWILLTTKALLFITVLIASIAILGVNGWLALRFTPLLKTSLSLPFDWQAVPNPPSVPDLSEYARRHLLVLIAAAAGVLGFLIAAAKMSGWEVLLRFLFQVPFAQSDPVYGRNIGFFLFSLPAYLALKNWMLLITILSGLIAGAVYWVRGGIVWDIGRLSMTPPALAHASVLSAIFFAVKAWSYYLDRFLLLYGDNGVVVGASYTDLTIGLPVLWVLVGLSFVASVASLANVQLRTYRLPLAATVLVFGSSLVLAEIAPALFQRLYVKPNELELEKPYLQHNITLTRAAYNLHQITAKPFPAEQSLNFAALQANQATIDNIRLWDGQPLIDAYRQLQEIRTYYKFHDVDVDRYVLD